MRGLWLIAVLLTMACGGRQSNSPTTVRSGGAAVPSGTSAEAPPPYDEEPVDEAPVDLDAFAKEPVVEAPFEEPEEASEKLERRDMKMRSYEEAMALPMDMGDVTYSGGETQLSGHEIARIMDGHLDDMYDECIRKELDRGNELGTVTIDLAIRGEDGMILGTTIDPGRRRFKKCLEDYLEDVRFPVFASPRMGARYRFHTS